MENLKREVKKEKIVKKVMLYSVTNNNRYGNMALANFVFALCKFSANINEYIIERHDLISADNIRNSAFESIIQYDILLFLIDEYPIKNENNNMKTKMYNPNVWFELGIASSQLEKPIIIISLYDEIPPFYASDLKPIVIPSKLKIYLDTYIEECSGCDSTDKLDTINTIYNKLVERIADSKPNREPDLVSAVNRFKEEFSNRLQTAQNPYICQHEISQFQNKINAIGHGHIYDLLEDLVKNTQAEFIDGEKKAFDILIKEVSKAEETLYTTRFANQSIVNSSSDNASLHNKFMEILYQKSDLERFERIICNNHYTKWNDIAKILIHGKKVRLFVRKCEYSIGFEIVIIDSHTTFIHFYQLSHEGNQNPDGTDYAADNQVINSTLMLTGNEVNVRMKKVFQRLHHRESRDPSRTLLGVPKIDTLNDEQKRHGFFEIVSSTDEEGNTTKVYNLLVKSFESWYVDMKTGESAAEMRDCLNMGVGIAVATDVVSSKAIAKFIVEKHNEDIDTFIKFVEEEINIIRKNKKEIEKSRSKMKNHSLQNMENIEHALDGFLSHLQGR